MKRIQTKDANSLAIRKALASLGTYKELADFFGIHPNNISNWVVRGEVPACHALEIHYLTGLPLWMLNSNVYPKHIFFEGKNNVS